MAGQALDLSGDKRLLRQLQAMGKAAAGKEIRSSSRGSMKIMHTEAKRLAPHETGTLRKNIKLRAGKRSRSKFSHYISWAKREKWGDRLTGKGFYPAAQEYGTDRHAAQSHILEARIRKGKQVEARHVRGLKNIVLKAARTR